MRSSASSPTLAELQAASPIFCKPATASSSTRRSTASRRTRKSEISGDQERLRVLRAAKMYLDLEAEWAQNDDEYARTSGVLEDVARALELQKRIHARKAAQQKLQPVSIPDSSDSDSFRLPSATSSSSPKSPSYSETQVICQPFPGDDIAEETKDCVTPPRASRSKSSQWISRFTLKTSQRELDDKKDVSSSGIKRLAPLTRFNPFVRARSESLSSISESLAPSPSRRRTFTLAGKA